LLGAAVGILEHPVPGAELAGRLDLPSRLGFSVGLGAAGVDRFETGGGSIELALSYGYAAVCLGLTRTDPEWGLCLRPMLGVLSGRGQDFERSHSESLVYGALSALVELRGGLSKTLGYSARAVAVAPFTRHGFSVTDGDDTTSAFTAPALGLLAFAGVSWGRRRD